MVPPAWNTAVPPAQLPQSPPIASAPPAAMPVPDAMASLLAYADRIRGLGAPELEQEIARLNDAVTPTGQLRSAIALAQTRQPYDLARAQDLLQKVQASNDAQAQKLQPLVRLLSARYAEQRRVEDLLERQSQQLRDTQKRLEQTTDKLEALKEIERSLTSRPAGNQSVTSPARNRASRPSAP